MGGYSMKYFCVNGFRTGMVCCAAWMLAAPGMVAAETADAAESRAAAPAGAGVMIAYAHPS